MAWKKGNADRVNMRYICLNSIHYGHHWIVCSICRLFCSLPYISFQSVSKEHSLLFENGCYECSTRTVHVIYFFFSLGSCAFSKWSDMSSRSPRHLFQLYKPSQTRAELTVWEQSQRSVSLLFVFQSNVPQPPSVALTTRSRLEPLA